MILYPRNSRTI